MIRTIGWFIYFGSYLLAVEPHLLKVERLAKEGKIEEHDEIVHTVAPKWARSLVKAKIELAKLPFINRWMEHLHCVFMDRSDVRQSLKVINQAADYLKQGYSMVIFPEGTRSKGDTLGEFKPGSLKLATKAGVPIVPITIQGSYKIMEQNKFQIKPAKVKITIHKPILTSDLSKEQASDLPNVVRETIKQAL